MVFPRSVLAATVLFVAFLFFVAEGGLLSPVSVLLFLIACLADRLRELFCCTAGGLVADEQTPLFSDKSNLERSWRWRSVFSEIALARISAKGSLPVDCEHDSCCCSGKLSEVLVDFFRRGMLK